MESGIMKIYFLTRTNKPKTISYEEQIIFKLSKFMSSEGQIQTHLENLSSKGQICPRLTAIVKNGGSFFQKGHFPQNAQNSLFPSHQREQRLAGTNVVAPIIVSLVFLFLLLLWLWTLFHPIRGRALSCWI